MVIDASGDATSSDDEPITALQTLSPGDHVIFVRTNDTDPFAIGSITFGALGDEPRSLLDATQEMTADDGMALTAENRALFSTRTAGLAQDAGGGLPGLSGRSVSPFSIGGSSSKTSRSVPADDATPSPSGEAPTGTMTTASLNPTSMVPSTTTSVGGGGVSSVPTTGGGGGGGGGGGTPTAGPGTGTPGTPTTPPGTPPPAPAPTP
ncbi:MAG: hypothetical protein AAF762_07675, partial [Pseudomonadota bacterium]